MLVRSAIALVWLYQGLWCKLLGRDRRHREIVSAAPLGGPAVMRIIGALECLLAVWVLSGWQGQFAALSQTLLLVSMNAGGLIWARRLIPDSAGMVIQNLAFLALVWKGVAQ